MFKIIIFSIFVGMTLAAVTATTAEKCKNDQNSGNYFLFQ